MYLHVGNNHMIRKDKIIAIINLETSNNKESIYNFFKNYKEKYKFESVYEKGKEKSLIITDDSCFLSPISSFTLLKRADYNSFNEDY